MIGHFITFAGFDWGGYTKAAQYVVEVLSQYSKRKGFPCILVEGRIITLLANGDPTSNLVKTTISLPPFPEFVRFWKMILPKISELCQDTAVTILRDGETIVAVNGTIINGD